MNAVGFLELILGPMFSGKTTRLIEIYNDLKDRHNVAVINFAEDTRYHDKMLSTHDRVMIPCLHARNIEDVMLSEEIQNSDVVLINEGQFFPDIYDSVMKLVETDKKRVYICGLDGDFQRNTFGNLLKLVPYSDKISKLHSNCDRCDQRAIFSHRITCETSQVVIGSSNYIPLCRTCYCLLTNDVINKYSSTSANVSA